MSAFVRRNAIIKAECILDNERNHGRYATAMEKAIAAYEAVLAKANDGTTHAEMILGA